MTLETLPPALSNWVTGEKFFNRETETAQLIRELDAGSHVLMTGQRRMGKTSIAREVGRLLQLRETPWIFIFVDLDDCEDESHMVAMLASEVARHDSENKKLKHWASQLATPLKNIAEVSISEFSISLRNSMTAGNWKTHGDELIQSIAGEKPCLLVIDELPNLLLKIEKANGASGVESVLRWLRRAIQSGRLGGLRIVVSGSIGMVPLVTRLGLVNAITGFEEMRVGPWPEETAIRCLMARARYDKITYTEDAIHWIIERLGILVPYHIQRVAKKASDLAVQQQDFEISVADLESIYEDMIRGGEYQLQHYRTRLKEALGEDMLDIAATLLTSCTDGKSRSRSECLEILGKSIDEDTANWLLDVLTHDGYLCREKDEWYFPKGILRDWWYATYVSFQ